MDKSWIHEYDRVGLKHLQGAINFIEFARKSSRDENLACPCIHCVNGSYYTHDIVLNHILSHGFSPSYTNWCFQGESLSSFDEPNQPSNTSSTIEKQYNVQNYLEDLITGHSNNKDGNLREDILDIGIDFTENTKLDCVELTEKAKKFVSY